MRKGGRGWVRQVGNLEDVHDAPNLGENETLNRRLDHLYHSLFVRRYSIQLTHSPQVKAGILPKSSNVICAQILLSFRIVPVAIYSSILFATPLPTPATL